MWVYGESQDWLGSPGGGSVGVIEAVTFGYFPRPPLAVQREPAGEVGKTG